MKTDPKKPKALLLYSGGLDSIIALELLKEQNIKTELIFFKLPFSNQEIPKINKIKTHTIDCTKPPLLKQYLTIIKKPKHGYGTALNPCRDCKIFMLKQAEKLRKKVKANFLATGEVLSQRPMSQLKHQLKLIEKKANLENKILRPLSAKNLDPTNIEKKGLINREKLLDIMGRSRKTQIKIAKTKKIKYPNSGGGCLLCEKHYKEKIKNLLKNKPLHKITQQDITLLNIGRHFKSSKTNSKLILGKNKLENKELEKLNKTLKQNILISKIPGPTIIFENKKDKELAKELQNAYSKNSSISKSKFEKLKIN